MIIKTPFYPRAFFFLFFVVITYKEYLNYIENYAIKSLLIVILSIPLAIISILYIRKIEINESSIIIYNPFLHGRISKTINLCNIETLTWYKTKNGWERNQLFSKNGQVFNVETFLGFIEPVDSRKRNLSSILVEDFHIQTQRKEEHKPITKNEKRLVLKISWVPKLFAFSIFFGFSAKFFLDKGRGIIFSVLTAFMAIIIVVYNRKVIIENERIFFCSSFLNRDKRIISIKSIESIISLSSTERTFYKLLLINGEKIPITSSVVFLEPLDEKGRDLKQILIEDYKVPLIKNCSK